MSATYTIEDREQDTCVVTGVSYGVRHTGSGRWYWKRGRFRDDLVPIFDGPQTALRELRWYFRESEIGGMELVPFQNRPPAAGCEAEAAALLEAGPQPLLPRDD